MKKPKAALDGSYDQLFENASNDAYDILPILAWEVGLNEKSASITTGVAFEIHEWVLIEDENGHI